MASLEDLAAMREREAAAAAAETARIAVSMRRVANEYKDVYAPLQDDTLLLMQTLTANVELNATHFHKNYKEKLINT